METPPNNTEALTAIAGEALDRFENDAAQAVAFVVQEVDGVQERKSVMRAVAGEVAAHKDEDRGERRELFLLQRNKAMTTRRLGQRASSLLISSRHR